MTPSRCSWRRDALELAGHEVVLGRAEEARLLAGDLDDDHGLGLGDRPSARRGPAR